MSDIQIMTREAMRERGRQAAREGKSHNSHNMNPNSISLQDWLDGYNEECQRQTAYQNGLHRNPAYDMAAYSGD